MTTMTRPASDGGKASVESRRSSIGYMTVVSNERMEVPCRRRYKAKSPSSFVDDTLFKTTASNSDGHQARGRLSGHEAVTISKEALQAMLQPSPVLTVDQRQALKKERELTLERARAHAKERKQRMLQLEEERKAHAPLTESEALKEKQDKATTRRARHLLDEQLDDVKQMNQMMLYAQCVAVRDRQVEEKLKANEEEKTENRRLDDIMEVNRQKAVKEAEDADKKRIESRYAGAKVIEQQLEERKKQRQKEAEIRRLESEEMLKTLERVKKEEEAAMLKKKEAADAMMQEVAKSNLDQIRRKEQMKQQEKEDDKQILTYIKQRDAREQEEASAKERIAKEKELETARLRAQQEKLADKQAEMDELRARRYQEAKEKEWRKKELEDMRQRQEALKELEKARESQKAAKIRQLGDMARIEQQEFFRVLEASKAQAAEEAKQEEAVHASRTQYKEDLLNQVTLNAEHKAKETEQQSIENATIQQKREADRQKLESIKQLKIEELRTAGIPEKYIADLTKKKITS